MTMNVLQPAFEAVVVKAQTFMIETKQMKNGRIGIVDRGFVFRPFAFECVTLAVCVAFLKALTHHKARKSSPILIATRAIIIFRLPLSRSAIILVNHPLLALPPSTSLESSSYLNCMSPGASLKTKYRPAAFQAQPSFHNRLGFAYNRLAGVLPILYLSKRGSSETIAASGYLVGPAPVQSLLFAE